MLISSSEKETKICKYIIQYAISTKIDLYTKKLESTAEKVINPIQVGMARKVSLSGICKQTFHSYFFIDYSYIQSIHENCLSFQCFLFTQQLSKSTLDGLSLEDFAIHLQGLPFLWTHNTLKCLHFPSFLLTLPTPFSLSSFFKK